MSNRATMSYLNRRLRLACECMEWLCPEDNELWYTKPDGTRASRVGAVFIANEYRSYSVVMFTNENGGERTIFDRGSRAEIDAFFSGIIAATYEKQRRPEGDAMTLYQELKQANCTLDNHEGDLYVLATEKAHHILRRYPVGYTRFIGTDGRCWLDIPSMFEPWWESRVQS